MVCPCRLGQQNYTILLIINLYLLCYYYLDNYDEMVEKILFMDTYLDTKGDLQERDTKDIVDITASNH